MTLAEYIKHLQTLPQNAEVFHEIQDGRARYLVEMKESDVSVRWGGVDKDGTAKPPRIIVG